MSVGLVLVSHSRSLAEGLATLVDQLTAGAIPTIPAGGLPNGSLGTNAETIVAAITEADQGQGVLLLADLGSAVLTARLVLEDAERQDVVLADAPFVEGAVAAGVLASTGASLVAVLAAAEDAWSFRKGTD